MATPVLLTTGAGDGFWRRIRALDVKRTALLRVAKMVRFQTPPDWWLSLANLTGWFDWNAITAIGTIGAASWAILTWKNEQNDRRRREAAAISAALHPIAVTGKVLSQMFAFIEEGCPKDVAVANIVAPGSLPNQQVAMRAIRAIDLPSPFSIDVVSAGVSTIDTTIDFAQQYLASANDRQREALLKALAECQRCALAYAWVLEREARLVSKGRARPMEAMGVEQIEALCAREAR